MPRSLEQLLGLKRLSLGDGGVRLGFAFDMPLWAWVFIAIGCAAFAWWCYWKLLGNRAARITLGMLRWALLLLVALLIAGPQLVKQEERVERDWVVVMADRSASMTIKDGKDPKSGDSVTRDKQLAETLRGAWPTLQELQKKRNVLFVGFDSAVYDLKTQEYAGPGTGGVLLGDPQGRRTAIGRSLDQVLRRIAARPVAGVVMLSDGRSSDTPGRAELKQLEARQIPVFTVALGSETSPPDLALARVDSPSAAFVNDIVPVTIDIESRGDTPNTPPLRGRIELVDKATGSVLDQQPLPTQPTEAPAPAEGVNTPAAPTTRKITLSARPTTPGGVTWTVRIVPDSPDLTADNNTTDLRIDLVDRPIRVVYFDGYPRWEYRYLKNLLLRESSIKSSTLLLSSDKRYIQEGSEPLDVIPRTAAAWAPMDVIILGDFRPEVLSEDQLRQIKDHVAQRGGGLLWIGGSGATPGAWRNTPLADLLPFTLAGNADDSDGTIGPRPFLDPVLMTPAPGATRLGVLRLGESIQAPWPAQLTRADIGWPLLRWAQRIEPSTLKPTAETIALAAPVRADSLAPDMSGATPLVVTMRYGAGRIVYVGTDETWRYRYARGEALPERFWLPIVRLLARDSVARSGKPASIEASPSQAKIDQPVRITVRLLDESLVERRPPSITVKVAAQSEANARPTEVELRPESGTTGAESASSVGTYSGTWVAAEPGIFKIDSQDPVLSGIDLSAQVQVILPDDELRTPQSDHPLLASISNSTGGKALRPDELTKLPDLLPNRELRVLSVPEIETLWDKPIVWILLISFLTAEWVGRRLIKLP